MEYQEQIDGDKVFTGNIEIIGQINNADLSRITTELQKSLANIQTANANFDDFINQIISDSVVDITEKVVLKQKWNEISTEYPLIVQRAKDKGLSETGLPLSGYIAKYNALDVMLNSAGGILWNMTVSTPIDAETVKNAFYDYYTAKEQTIAGIADVITDGVNAEIQKVRNGDLVDGAINRAKLEAGFLEEHNSMLSQIAIQTDEIAARVRARTYNPNTDTWSDTEAFMALRVALPETMSLDRKNAIYSLLSSSEKTIFDRIYELYQVKWYGGSEYRYKITANPIQDDINSMTATFAAKGLLSSQFLVDADELFLKGTIKAEYLDIDTISAFVVDAVQANIDNLAAKKVVIDSDPNSSVDFETYIDKDSGILAKKDNKIIFQISPSGGAYFNGSIDANSLNVQGNINAGVFVTEDYLIPAQTITTPAKTHWCTNSIFDALSQLPIGTYSADGNYNTLYSIYKISKDSNTQISLYTFFLWAPVTVIITPDKYNTIWCHFSITNGPSFDSNNVKNYYANSALISAFINKVPNKAHSAISGTVDSASVTDVYLDIGNEILFNNSIEFKADGYSTSAISITIPAQSSNRWLIGTDEIGRYELWPHNIPGSSDEIITIRNTDPNDVFSILEIRSPDKYSGASESTLSLHVVNGYDDFVNDKTMHNYSGVMKVLEVFSNFGGSLPTEARWEWVRNDSGGEVSLMHLYAKNGGIWTKGGRKPTGTFFSNGTFTLDKLYNALSPAIPNVGDIILLHGGTRGSIVVVHSHAERISDTTIRLYCIQDNLASTLDITANSTDSYTGISLAW